MSVSAYSSVDLSKIEALVVEHFFDGFLVPNICTDVRAVWRLVEALGYAVTIHGPGAPLAYGEYRNTKDQWLCEIDDPKGKEHCDDTISAYADTAPLAICLAALRSKGISYP